MMTEAEIDESDQPEIDVDAAVAAVGGYVDELRDLLREHHTVLTRATITAVAAGGSLQMPKASENPQYAAKIHRLIVACDNFVNATNGQY